MSVTGIFHRIASISLAGGLLVAAAHAGDAGVTDEQACSQLDRAYLAMQACSRLLAAPDLEQAKKVRLYEQRARASLILFYFAEAAEDFSAVLAAEPDNATILAGRGEAFSEDGQYSKAAEDWSRLAALRPDDVAARLQLGKNLHAAGSYDKAAVAYEEAVKLDAKNSPALIGLARAYDMAGKLDKSDEKMAEALKINQENSSALLVRGEIAERRGNTALAIESYKLSLKANGMQIRPRQALQRLGIETPP